MQKSVYLTLQETLEEPQAQNKEVYGLLLVNSRSGSRLGSNLVKSHMKEIKFSTIPGTNSTFLIYDLYEAAERKQAFVDAETKAKEGAVVFIIMCGGDGTIEWVINEALTSQIDLTKVIFTTLPIGTGNDFAKSIGWGDFSFSVSQNKFEELAVELNLGTLGYFDIWHCEVECFESGSIIEIKNGIETEMNEKILSKNFTNYFGVGTDAQICYIAQKLKAKTVLLKKIAYGFAGFLSFWMFCGSLKRKIQQMLEVQNPPPTESTQLEQTQAEIVSAKTQKQAAEKINIGSFDCCFTFLNSTSSMQLRGVWDTPYIANSLKAQYKQQSVNDGLIEIVSYRNQISLCFERALHMAKKVGQGKGPFLINFKEPKPDINHSVYIHVNGEPYKVNNIKSIKVAKSTAFADGKIRVLYRKQ